MRRRLSLCLAGLLTIGCASTATDPAEAPRAASLRARIAQRDPAWSFTSFLHSGGFGAERDAISSSEAARAYLEKLERELQGARGSWLFYVALELAERLHEADLWEGVPAQDSGRATRLLRELLGQRESDASRAPFDSGLLSIAAELLVRIASEGGAGLSPAEREQLSRFARAWYTRSCEQLARARDHEALAKLHLDLALLDELYHLEPEAGAATRQYEQALVALEAAIRDWDALAPGEPGKDIFSLGSLHMDLADLYARGKLAAGVDVQAAMRHYEEARLTGWQVTSSVARLQGRPVAPSAARQVVATPGRRVALVVGNGSYRHAPRLANPVSDAGAMAARLGELGFEVVWRTDVGRFGMRTALQAFGDKSEGAALALVYFAGHGLQVDGVNYLLPVDALLSSRRDLANYALPLEEVLQQFAPSARTRVLVLDACRDNPLAAALASGAGAEAGESARGLVALRQSPANTLIAYSTAPGSVAEDGAGANSPYTSSLVHWLFQPLELNDLFRHVREDVRERTQGRQTPWESSSLGGEEIFLVGSQ